MARVSARFAGPVAAVLMLAACGRDAPGPSTPGAERSAETRSASAAPVADAPRARSLPDAIRDAAGGDVGNARYFDGTIDLNDDGRAETVVYLAGPSVCGSGGCPVLVFTPEGEGVRLVSQLSVVQPPIRVATRRSNGWRNLIVHVAGGGRPADEVELQFDGATYPSNPTVVSPLPTSDADPSELLIPEFQTYRDGKPLAAAGAPTILGDPDAPVAATVLGTVVRTEDADDLRYLLLQQLTDRYAAAHDIDATPAETEAYARQVQRALERDRAEAIARREALRRELASANLPAPRRDDLAREIDELDGRIAALAEPAAESAEDAAARAEIAAAFVRQWKIDRALHREYGGRIAYQQGGPEPVDAYRKFLEASEARGDFRIENPSLAPGFWRYYRDDSMHSFMAPGSSEEARAFASPPWQPTR